MALKERMSSQKVVYLVKAERKKKIRPINLENNREIRRGDEI